MARGGFLDCLALARHGSDQFNLGEALAGLSTCAARAGSWIGAARRAGTSEAVHEQIGAPPWEGVRSLQAGPLAIARGPLGAEHYAARFAEGRRLPVEDSVAAIQAAVSTSVDRVARRLSADAAGSLPARVSILSSRRIVPWTLGCRLGVVVVVCVITSCGGATTGPLRIGVMLPLTGPDAVGARGPLEWARENVNAAGGVAGRPIEFVYRDLNHRSPLAFARAFACDSSISAVIGPANSEDAFQVASLFFNRHKVMLTPSAASADLFRAFSSHHPQYLWRPVEFDIAQMRTMLEVATHGGARSVALVSGDSAYGSTFFDAFGFLATEAGLRGP
jgi:ABC-type branched-subunit amino acid transport system substrate-binding protein